MTAKEWLHRFHWGRLCCAVFTCAAGISLACLQPANERAAEISAGVLFLLSGILCVTNCLMRLDGATPFCLLFGAAEASLSVWLFAASPVRAYILAVATGVLLLLLAADECYDALQRPKRRRWQVRLGFAVAAAICSLFCFIDLFKGEFAIAVYAGYVLLCFGLYALVRTFLLGVMEEEEELTFRPIKKVEKK